MYRSEGLRELSAILPSLVPYLSVQDLRKLTHVFMTSIDPRGMCLVDDVVNIIRTRVEDARAGLEPVSDQLTASVSRSDFPVAQAHVLSLGRLAAAADVPGASAMSTTYVVARALTPGPASSLTTEHYRLLKSLVGFNDPVEEPRGVEASCHLTRTYALAWACLDSRDERVAASAEYIMLCFAGVFANAFGVRNGIRFFGTVMAALSVALNRGSPRGVQACVCLYACAVSPDGQWVPDVYAEVQRAAARVPQPLYTSGRCLMRRNVTVTTCPDQLSEGFRAWFDAMWRAVGDHTGDNADEVISDVQGWLLRKPERTWACIRFAELAGGRVLCGGALPTRVFLPSWPWSRRVTELAPAAGPSGNTALAPEH
eukprot:jgi/Mesvir1/20342/Mv19931-RA.1